MTQLVPKLQNQLDHIIRLLDNPPFAALTPKNSKGLRQEAVTLSQRLAQARSAPLVAGLLGGTGVGKSTLLNALAGAEISEASHRRPKTNHILVYRHEEASMLSPKRLENLPWREYVHRNNAIGKILLCDLPDFDSIQVEHRQRVISFLEHLDLLIWVTSPEKYADQQFHDFLSSVPKAQTNFYFVLNKLDLAFQGKSVEQGYETVTKMSQAFEKRLRESGVPEPLIFLISAKNSVNGEPTEPWDQFSSFKNQVFQERRLKEVMAIKASNLDVEVQGILRRFREGIRVLETFVAILEESLNALKKERTDWLNEWAGIIEGWVDNRLRVVLRGQRPDPIPLLGPGYGLAALLDKMKKRSSREDKNDTGIPSDLLPETGFSLFKNHLEAVATRLETACLHHHLPESFQESVETSLRRSDRIELLKRAVSQALARRWYHIVWPPFWGFKVGQGICYFFLFAVFILAVGGEGAWTNVMNDPGVKTVALLALSVIHTLFSGKGLAALGSYIVLNLFLGLRFYRRFLKMVQRTSDKTASALKKELVTVWEQEMDGLVGSLEKMSRKIREGKKVVETLTDDTS